MTDKTSRLRRLRLPIASAAVLAVLAAGNFAAATTWNVSSVSQLNSAFGGYSSGDEILIAPGTYYLTNNLFLTRPDVTVRGATGSRNDVILDGGGMNVSGGVTEGISVSSDDITIRDLTLREFYHHGIHLRAENDADRYHIANVYTLNCGERHIKGSTSGAYISENGIIEHVRMEQTIPLTNHNDNDYIGGMDIMSVSNLIVRDCQAINIQGANGGGRAGIFLWNDVYDPIVERNQIVGCDRGIAFGNPGFTGTWATEGGIARNNFVTRGAGIAVELCYTKDLKFYNNSIYSSDPAYFRTVQLYGASTTNLDSRYNLIRGGILRNGTDWSETGNITGSAVETGWFVDPGSGDLHLTALATAAIDQATTLADVTDDYDAHARPVGDHPDIGADEYGSSAGPQLPTPPPAAPPAGVPYLDWAYQYAGDGLYGVTFTVRGNDSKEKAFFADASFEGADGGQIVQQKAIIIPGSLEYDVHSETDADAYDGMGTPPYDKDADCWFGDAFVEPPANVMVLTESENYYHIEAGTGAASAYTDAKLAYICTDGNVSYAVSISRLAVNWPYAGTLVLPPPGDANYDGLVDGGDYTIWADCYSDTGLGWGGADYNGDGVTDGGDYTIWADFYGTGTAAAIPEPATLALLAASVVFACRRRRRP